MPATEHRHLIERIAGSFNTGALDAIPQLVSPSLAGFTRDVGVMQGRTLQLSGRQGVLWGKMPARGLWPWALLVAARLVMTLPQLASAPMQPDPVRRS